MLCLACVKCSGFYNVSADLSLAVVIVNVVWKGGFLMCVLSTGELERN